MKSIIETKRSHVFRKDLLSWMAIRLSETLALSYFPQNTRVPRPPPHFPSNRSRQTSEVIFLGLREKTLTSGETKQIRLVQCGVVFHAASLPGPVYQFYGPNLPQSEHAANQSPARTLPYPSLPSSLLLPWVVNPPLPCLPPRLPAPLVTPGHFARLLSSIAAPLLILLQQDLAAARINILALWKRAPSNKRDHCENFLHLAVNLLWGLQKQFQRFCKNHQRPPIRVKIFASVALLSHSALQPEFQ